MTINVSPHRKQERRPVSESPLRLPSHYSAAVLLEDSEGQRRLNSSVECSLETNQEKARINSLSTAVIHCYFLPDFSLAFDSLRKRSCSIKSMFH